MPDREPLIIHHAGCSDGICGALTIWLGLKRRGELLAAQYGDEPPSDDSLCDREVWIVDFSYPREILEHMNSVAARIHVLDHHITAKENCEGLSFCTFDMARSGARMAFDRMLAGRRLRSEAPALVETLDTLTLYVQDRDLWRWHLANSRQIAAWFESYPRDLDHWRFLLERLLVGGFGLAISHGVSIMRSNERLIRSMVSQKEMVGLLFRYAGHRVALCNAPVLHSEVAERLLDETDCNFACCWRRLNDGRYVYNLRSRPGEVDVSEVAMALEGGGHPQAAGFASSSPPWDIFSFAGRDK